MGDLVANFEREQKSEVLREAAHRLTVWIDGNRELSLSTMPLENSLLKAINDVHASSVRASVRRQGEWYKLDYSHQLGYGSRMKALMTVQQKQQDFVAIVKNIRDDSDMEEAYGLARQVHRLFETGIESLLRNSQQVGVTVHVNDMQSSSEPWDKCEGRWGQGPGYRNDVVDFHKEWFENRREATDARFLGAVELEWERLLARLSDILAFE